MNGHRWIVTDLDGTLVDRDLRMVARSREALRRFRLDGGAVVFATGRSRASAKPYYEELGLTGPAILLNGAQIRDLSTGEILLDVRLPKTTWKPVRDRLEHLPPGTAAVVFVGDAAYRVTDSALITAYAARDRLTVEVLPDWRELPPDRVSKAMILCEDTATAQHTLRLADPLGATAFISEPTYVELLPPAVDKGTALRHLAERLGVPLHAIAAVGDNPNDIPMFAVAGLSAAVGDGHPDARKAATMVLGSCAGGAVAELVDHVTGGRS